MASVKMILGGAAPITVPLGAELIIGRSEEADLCVPDNGVSRKHSRIILTREGYVIEDLGSRNGTYVNGQRKDRHVLNDRDRIEVSTGRFIFFADEPSTIVGTAIVREESPPQVISTHRPIESAIIEKKADDQVSRLELRLDVLHKLSDTIGRSIDNLSLFEQLLETLMQVFPRAERGHIVLLDDEGDPVPAASRGRNSAGGSVGLSRTVIEKALHDGEAIFCADASDEQEFEDAVSIAQLNIRSILCAPMKGRDRMLGVIYLDSSSSGQSFRADDLEMLCDIAALAAVAIDRSRLVGENIQNLQLARVGAAIGGLAYRIRAILSKIQTAQAVVELGLKNNELDRVQSGWQVVRTSTEFLSEMVLDMLAYSSQKQPIFEDTDIVALMDEICMLAQERAFQKKVRLEFKPGRHYMDSRVDRAGIKRCVGNVLHNAIDACEGLRDPKVTARVLPKGDDAVIITVEDNGCGIPEDVRNRLFEAFSTTKGEKGTGLGLPVARKIVEEHGGSMSVESEIGKGSKFTITLPTQPPEDVNSTRRLGG